MYLIYLYLGRTSLMYAAWDGYTEIVKILLEHGADVNTKDYEGQLHNISLVHKRQRLTPGNFWST